jgi:hypothetical protein
MQRLVSQSTPLLNRLAPECAVTGRQDTEQYTIGLRSYSLHGEDMATQPERIASLEQDKKWHWIVLSALAVGFAAWLGFVTVSIVGMKGDLQAVKQKINDGGLGDIVSKIQNPSSPEQLSTTLELVTSLLDVQRLQGHKPDPVKLARLSSAVKNVATKDPNLPSVWQAATQLVNYRSVAVGGPARTDLPNCLDINRALLEIQNTPEVQFEHAVEVTDAVRDCHLDLDATESFATTAAGLFFSEAERRQPGVAKMLQVENGTVTYSGGPMIPINRVVFKNCVFVFQPAFGLPPKAGQSLTSQLLTADMSNASIRLPTGM